LYMCRLFGLYANRPVDVLFSFYMAPEESFADLSRWNPHGWGIAWLDGGQWRIYKEAGPLYKSNEARSLIRNYVHGRIIVSHVRLATAGEPRRENAHPWLYRGWVFAHNGSMTRRAILKLLRDEYRDLEGETDSEVFFHLIIQEVRDLGDPVEGIKRAIEKIIESGIQFTSLNFIASDGAKLYALRYANTRLSYYTLYYIERPREGLELKRLSKETRQLISMKLARGEKAVIVASEIMSDEPHWRQIPNKHLMIINEDLSVELIPIER